jgi:hypothetical protein
MTASSETGLKCLLPVDVIAIATVSRSPVEIAMFDVGYFPPNTPPG